MRIKFAHINLDDNPDTEIDHLDKINQIRNNIYVKIKNKVDTGYNSARDRT